MNFVHLHVHSHYSLLDGLSQIGPLIDQAKEFGMEALALTDHGSMYGAIEFYQKAKAAELKPIIGVEVYLAPRGRKSKRGRIDAENYHLILLAENFEGYKNLLKLVSLSHTEGFYYKPRVDFELLEKYSSGLIAASACIQGEIPRAVLSDKDLTKAEEVLDKYLKIFGKDNFFLELQHHPSMPEQDVVNKKLYQLAQNHKLGVIATNDSHYIKKDDDKAQDILICIQTNRKVFEQDRLTMVGEDFSLRSPEEMAKAFDWCPEAIENTNKIAQRCNLEIPLGEIQLPYFKVPEGFTAESYLKDLVYKGLPNRYGGEYKNNQWVIDEKELIVKSSLHDFYKEQILERVAYELEVILNTGYSAYFLIVADFINWAKERGIAVGPGRGSAAGSIVAYLLKITDLDPLKYDLLFERFLNPDRISMPDIDIDFADIRREEVIRYVEDKYGKEKVSMIITFGTMAARVAIRDVGRVLDIELSYCDKIAKMIPMNTKLGKALEEVPELKQEYKNDTRCQKLIDNALKLEGVARHTSTHACGVLITKDPLYEFVPVQYASTSDQTTVSQYSLKPVEDLGLLKMDFLGLKNLTIIEECLNIIEKTKSLKVDIEKIELDDQKAYKLFQVGETTGIFQLESAGMKRYLKQLKPTVFEDIIAIVALYRPGPMQFIDTFINRKHGKEKIKYLHPSMEKALCTTYGVTVYQEQVMALSKDMAGFTGGQADTLRKAIGKKKADLMAKMKDEFVKGCVKNSINVKIAEEVWKTWEAFAQYCFNKSHAACYALIAYRTAFLKANYPTEFMAALLTADLNDMDRVAIEVNECSRMGIEVLPPDINESKKNFTVIRESLEKGTRQIRFGLGAIKNLGLNIVEIIIEERKKNGPFKSLEDLLLRVKDLNKKSLESLIKSGALDRFMDRKKMFNNLERLLLFIKDNQAPKNQDSLFSDTATSPKLSLSEVTQARKMELLLWEKEYIGLYISEHPFTDFGEKLKGFVVPVQDMKNYISKTIKVGGIINTVKRILTKKNQRMAFVDLEDITGHIDTVIFPSIYEENIDIWQEETPVIIKGKVEQKDEDITFICQEVKIINEDNLDFFKHDKIPEQNIKTAPEPQVSNFNPPEPPPPPMPTPPQETTMPPSTVEQENQTVPVAENNPSIENKKSMVFIQLREMISSDTCNSLISILNSFKGNIQVVLEVPNEEGQFKKLETNFSINFSDSFKEKLNQINFINSIRLG